MTAIAISPKLKDYLNRKSIQALVVEVAECKTCGGAVAVVFARPARPKEAKRLRESSCRTLEADSITIFLTHPLIRVDEQVLLGLRNFLGLKDVTVEGLHL